MSRPRGGSGGGLDRGQAWSGSAGGGAPDATVDRGPDVPGDGVPVDLPQVDPGIPRFLFVVAASAAVAAAWLIVRPAGAPLASPAGSGAVAATPAPLVTGAGLYLREGCGECHAMTGPSTALGPTLSGVRASAARRIADPAYSGAAQTPEEYLREASLDHCLDLLPGYTCPDLPEFGLRLSLDEVDRLVRFIAGPEGEAAP